MPYRTNMKVTRVRRKQTVNLATGTKQNQLLRLQSELVDLARRLGYGDGARVLICKYHGQSFPSIRELEGGPVAAWWEKDMLQAREILRGQCRARGLDAGGRTGRS